MQSFGNSNLGLTLMTRSQRLLLFVSSILVLLVSSACGGAQAGNNAIAAGLTASPSAINFGSDPVSATTTTTLTLTNTSTADLQIQNITVAGSTAFQASNWTNATVLHPGAALNVDVSFTPSAAGTYSGTMTILTSQSAGEVVTLSGTGSGTASGISVSITPTSAALQVNSSAQFAAQVKGTSNTSVNWLVNGVRGGNASVGTISSSGLYIAPSAVPSGGSVTVSASSQANPSKSANASVAISSTAPPVSVSVSPTSSSLGAGQSQQFNATVTGTSNTTVNWYVGGIQGGSASLGTISAAGLYIAPACPTDGSQTITAQSVYDSAASASAIVTLTGGVPPGQPGVYYVATNGTDSNSGTACSPWATINHADSVVAPGSVVHVAAGTYSENVSTSASGTSSAPITYISDTQWGAKIVGNSDSVWLATGNYVTIAGFDVTSSNSATRLGILDYGSVGRIIGNRVHDIQAQGAGSNGGAAISPNNNQGGAAADYTEVSENMVYNIGMTEGGDHVQGIYINGTNFNLVSNNLVFLVTGWGVHQYHQPVSNSTIVNNTIFNSGGGILIGSDGTGPNVTDYNYVANNIVVNNGALQGGTGIRECCDASNIGSHNTYTNNLVNNNSPVNYSFYFDVAQNSITADPLFVNYTGDQNGNYHLQSSSPAIDSGASTKAPKIDFSGAPRPKGAGWDRGAYEYGSTPHAWPWY